MNSSTTPSIILNALDIFLQDETQEELEILITEQVNMTEWEREFIMDCAENNWLSDKQSDIIANIYRKYIDDLI